MTAPVPRRLLLQKFLLTLPEVKAVYYQPPEAHKMEYPSIVYEHSRTQKRHANNNPYHKARGYQLTVMDYDPDSPLFDAIEDLPMCAYDRGFAVGELNHKIFTLYF